MPCQLIGWDHYLGRKRMPYYIVNKNAQPNTRDHEVHLTPRTNCSSPRYPAPQNRESLGFHSTCHEQFWRQKGEAIQRQMAVITVQTPVTPADSIESSLSTISAKRVPRRVRDELLSVAGRLARDGETQLKQSPENPGRFKYPSCLWRCMGVMLTT